MKSVSIIAATISGNRGAEAMLTTTIGEIRQRYPDCRFNVFSYYPQQDRALNRDDKVAVYSATPLVIVTLLFPFSILFALFKLPLLNRLLGFFPAPLQALNQSDVLIDLAGVAFIDGREKFLPYNVLTLVPAFLLNTPVVKFSQALGPFKNPLNRILALATLKQCKQIFARGEGTHQHLQSLKLNNLFASPVADVAFRHQPDYNLSEESDRQVAELSTKLKAEQRPIIGICPSSVLAAKHNSEEADYTESLTQLCRQLLDRGYALLLFPNATRKQQGEKLRNNDLPVIQRISQQLAGNNGWANNLYAVDFDINTNGIKSLMSVCRIVLVSRFHAMIAALSAKQPVIVIGWSHKYKEVMDAFDLGELVYDFKQTQMAPILQSIVTIIDDDREVKNKLEQQLPGVIASSAQQFEYLFTHLD
ncbi:MAG: polysaccharide pyruvyl transferase family protein [Candidatus Thiodiazotropha lotti]|uniref:Polysaccharide pyruvyl transferase family protein n=1 Tax=Candidatus Thiodiazotropha lotti TaxID=2792787 RepID=A0A9E4K6V7_9GAMM|nr:polysaccharide pyruvyl transferase family protein [Candidatus Thiodiazotropha lotti]MCG7940402.1 polysaccharide pyruvyl transferase family protein [Candidatus Thiodiazotropha lotti]MCW4204876.1 polysaccharide pyruvyl transferase family protein [Candidatus Thiodiazotropha lotti]MCW4219462.1 polysaccharide pyruvyl transferase family protein [Candidatus Thiodiazotropha lotti]